MKKTLVLTITLTLLLSGVALAQTSTQAEALPSPGILPGNPLYFVKSIGEKLGSLFTFGAEAKARRSVELAEKRLAEVQALAERGDVDRASSTIGRYQSELNDAERLVNQASTSTRDDIASLVASSTLRHQSALSAVYERVPEQAKSAIQHAIEVSMRGHDQALSVISEEAREDVQQKLQEVRNMVEGKLNDLRSQGVPIPENVPPDFDGAPADPAGTLPEEGEGVPGPAGAMPGENGPMSATSAPSDASPDGPPSDIPAGGPGSGS